MSAPIQQRADGLIMFGNCGCNTGGAPLVPVYPGETYATRKLAVACQVWQGYFPWTTPFPDPKTVYLRQDLVATVGGTAYYDGTYKSYTVCGTDMVDDPRFANSSGLNGLPPAMLTPNGKVYYPEPEPSLFIPNMETAFEEIKSTKSLLTYEEIYSLSAWPNGTLKLSYTLSSSYTLDQAKAGLESLLNGIDLYNPKKVYAPYIFEVSGAIGEEETGVGSTTVDYTFNAPHGVFPAPESIGATMVNGAPFYFPVSDFSQIVNGLPATVKALSFYDPDGFFSSIPGKNYAVGDVVSLTGGITNRPASFKVTAVNSKGAIISATLLSSGFYAGLPPTSSLYLDTGGVHPSQYVDVVAISGGSGQDGVVQVGWEHSSINILAVKNFLRWASPGVSPFVNEGGVLSGSPPGASPGSPRGLSSVSQFFVISLKTIYYEPSVAVTQDAYFQPTMYVDQNGKQVLPSAVYLGKKKLDVGETKFDPGDCPDAGFIFLDPNS